MRKLFLLVLALSIVSAFSVSALDVNLAITNIDGLTYTFECQASGFTPETYDWDIGYPGDQFVAYDVNYGTTQYTFAAPGPQRASCVAWDADTNEVGIHEIYFDVNETVVVPEPNVTDVSFRGCSEVWIVFESFEEGQTVNAVIQTSEGPQNVVIEYDDLTVIPGHYGSSPVYKYDVHAHLGDDAKILGVDVGGATYENTNNCASRGNGPVVVEAKKGKK